MTEEGNMKFSELFGITSEKAEELIKGIDKEFRAGGKVKDFFKRTAPQGEDAFVSFMLGTLMVKLFKEQFEEEQEND